MAGLKITVVVAVNGRLEPDGGSSQPELTSVLVLILQKQSQT
jgi:hypothetical protein